MSARRTALFLSNSKGCWLFSQLVLIADLFLNGFFKESEAEVNLAVSMEGTLIV